MDIILIPGLWLDGSSWHKVVPFLERAGHRVVALTPPGHDGQDPATVTYGDLVAALVTEIDNSAGHVMLVGHSAGSAAAWAAADRRPEQVGCVVLVGGFPIPGGSPILDGLEPVDGVVPFPGWAAFEGPDSADLDDDAKAELESHMTPAPGQYVVGLQELGDDRRYGLPVVNVCTEYSADELRGWVEQGFPPVSELRHLRQAGFVDLESGHWPQISRAEDLAEVILRAATVR